MSKAPPQAHLNQNNLATASNQSLFVNAVRNATAKRMVASSEVDKPMRTAQPGVKMMWPLFGSRRSLMDDFFGDNIFDMQDRMLDRFMGRGMLMPSS